MGRGTQRSRPDLVRPDWDTAKLFVMLAALQAKVRRLSLPCFSHGPVWAALHYLVVRMCPGCCAMQPSTAL